MSKLYTYVVTHDTGLAPNPFWGCCTVAVCTPNHSRCKAIVGDWIVGFLDKKHDYRFLYAMEISERIYMDDYFRDPRFESKKPRLRGSLMQRCGDNFYSIDDKGSWKQHETLLHRGLLAKDTKNPWVFAGQRFWYQGRDTCTLPDTFHPLAGGRGVRVNHPPALAEQFKCWVIASFREGVTAMPRDFDILAIEPKITQSNCNGPGLKRINGHAPVPKFRCD